jgi:hypothetical protein
MDARRSPRWVFGSHVTDQVPEFFTDLRPAVASSPGPESPEQSETSTMPGHHGIRLHNNQRISPSGPQTVESNPEQSVKALYSRSRLFPLDHDELLAQRRNLQTKVVPVDKECAAIGEYRDNERYHHSNRTRPLPPHRVRNRLILLEDSFLMINAHYHTERNHQGLANRIISPEEAYLGATGAIQRRQRLGGTLNYYYRAAA